MAGYGQPQIYEPLAYRSVYSNHEQLRLFQSVPINSGHAHLFVPQKVYRPHSNRDWSKYVEEVELKESIKFLSDDKAIHGVALVDAVLSQVEYLVGKEDDVFQGLGPSVSIQIEVSRQ
jgi:hypothetical protein